MAGRIRFVGTPPPGNDAVPKIEIRGLRHEYRDAETGRSVLAIESLDLEVATSEFVCIVGPSGCGKSTLLSIIAGLIPARDGRVLLDGVPVRGPSASRGMVFQEFAILPWRTVAANIGHGLELQGVARQEREDVVRRYVDLMNLRGFESKYPHELSGGMKQRVAVARTLAANPEVMLMDEPFASLDAQTRITLEEETVRIGIATRKTIIFVTHSVEEAVFLGDRVIIFSRGPSHVKESVPISIPREERVWNTIISDPRFIEPRDHVMRSVREEVLVAIGDRHDSGD
jgi:NitT/TauT family transport system ATP-binding protein